MPFSHFKGDRFHVKYSQLIAEMIGKIGFTHMTSLQVINSDFWLIRRDACNSDLLLQSACMWFDRVLLSEAEGLSMNGKSGCNQYNYRSHCACR